MVRRPLTFVAPSHTEREDRTDWCPSRSVPAREGTSGKDRCFELPGAAPLPGTRSLAWVPRQRQDSRRSRGGTQQRQVSGLSSFELPADGSWVSAAMCQQAGGGRGGPRRLSSARCWSRCRSPMQPPTPRQLQGHRHRPRRERAVQSSSQDRPACWALWKGNRRSQTRVARPADELPSLRGRSTGQLPDSIGTIKVCDRRGIRRI
jgi:hypothetical protein